MNLFIIQLHFRVVSMAWVILAHRYMLFLVSASNPNDILQVSYF